MNYIIPTESQIREETEVAVRCFWDTRSRQSDRQAAIGNSDQGTRSAVTGGGHLNGFIELLKTNLITAGIESSDIYTTKDLYLPGFYRPTKKWDIIVVKTLSSGEKRLIAVIELKSQVGPSFGNNGNNRTEEAIGSASDIWVAYREGRFGINSRPWLGYLMVLESCASSLRNVNVKEPHFKIDDAFQDSSYTKRFEILCRRLVLERLYTSACLLSSEAGAGGLEGSFIEPATDLTIHGFIASLIGHVITENARS
jgi:hypothetical protein